MSPPRKLHWLSDLPPDLAAGGKAQGLARLMRLGLRVPDGFVLLNGGNDDHPGALETAFQRLGARVAVRSSGLSEDGLEASYAGQYETILEVVNFDALCAAITRCQQSASSARSSAYAHHVGAGHAEAALPIVVQRMVSPRVAGVLFTLDPVSGDTDRVVIEAIAGLGEALVSGQATPDRYVLSRSGEALEQQCSGATPMLSLELRRALLEQALRVAQSFEQALDLEWAIDADNTLWWLQARPITTSFQARLDEFDTPGDHDRVLYTRYNAGEVLPGAMTPLSLTLGVAGLERAMRQVWTSVGVFPSIEEAATCVAHFSGQIFLNLSTLYLMSQRVMGATKEGSDLSLAGHVLPEVELPPRASFWQRLQNGLRLQRLVSSGPRLLLQAEADWKGFQPDLSGELPALLERLKPFSSELVHVGVPHLVASTRSGIFSGILQALVTDNKPPQPPHHRALNALLCTDEGVVGTEILQELANLHLQLEADPAAKSRLLEGSSADAVAWLLSPEAADIGARFRAFLAAHGHRGVREAELSEPDWLEDPRPVVDLLRNALQGHAPKKPPPPDLEAALAPLELSWLKRRIIAWILPKARASVQERERGKSLLVLYIRRMKRLVLRIAEELVKLERLPELELIYFLSLDELGKLVEGPQPALIRRAVQRRHLYPQQNRLVYPMVSRGKPTPTPTDQAMPEGLLVLSGTPVCAGQVEARARVVRTLDEAAHLVAGEILVVAFTDIGWTPYFSLAAGLLTEIGGMLSHGAVVAREYGLPAIVNLPDVTRCVRTGDLLRLDAYAGKVHILERA